jgi:hypothetical protein
MLMVGDLLAIAALERNRLFLDHLEMGGHLLVIADTFGIHALGNAGDLIGYHHNPFLDHLVIPDDIQLGIGSHQ